MTEFSRLIHALPMLWSILIGVTTFTPYIIAVSLDHVYPFLPSISKTAAFEPEGSIFGFLMSFVAFFGLLFIFCRYLQLDRIRGDFEQDIHLKVKRFNKVSVPFGVLCMISVEMVASFRSPLKEEDSVIGETHGAATGLLLVSGGLYCVFQTLISYHTVKVGLNTKCTLFFRSAVSCILIFSGAGYYFFKWSSYTEFRGSESSIKVANWSPDNGGYTLHVAASAGEWIACLSLAIYPSLFHNEFQTFSIEDICVEYKGMTKNGDYSVIKQCKDEDADGELDNLSQRDQPISCK